MPQNMRKRVYVWEFPVRFTHWITFLCLFSLGITGYYIAHPFIHAISTRQYIMGWMRFIHLVSGYLLLMSMIIRIYWMIAGNRYSSWRVFIPITNRQWQDMLAGLKFYFFLSRKPPYAVGHSAMASLTYLGVFILLIFEIIAGFALYSQGQSGFFATILGGWLLTIISAETLRLWHHLVMYFLFAFTIIHIYTGWYNDSLEGNGAMGSIFGGYKFVTGKEWE